MTGRTLHFPGPGALSPIMLAAMLAACGPGASSDGSEDSGDTGDDTCAESLCGCPDNVTLEYIATVVDLQDTQPIVGVEVFCQGETAAIAVSDGDGLVTFALETTEQPGCGYARCNTLRFVATSGPYDEVSVGLDASNGGTVALPYLPD